MERVTTLEPTNIIVVIEGVDADGAGVTRVG